MDAINISKIISIDSINIKDIEHWLTYSVLIGIATGSAAIIFYFLIEIVTTSVLGEISGYYPPPSGGETTIFPQKYKEINLYVLAVIPAIGGLISGVLTYHFAPETEASGKNAIIHSFHHEGGIIRKRVPFIRLINSSITLGTGGSAGREGPVAQIGAGFGSILANKLKLSDHDRRLMVVCGTAGGIGSIFKSPFGGALFAIEVLYRRDFEIEGIVPAFVSSIIAYSIFSSIFGWGSLFKTPPFKFNHPVELIFYAILGVSAGLLSIFYIKIFYVMRDLFRKIPIKNHFKPAIGGIFLGILVLLLQIITDVPHFLHILGTGYGLIQMAIDRKVTLTISIMLVLVFLKIISTAFTISSGGSGGVFAPTLVIGALLGGAFGEHILMIFPNLIKDPSSFVLVGMAAMLAGAAKVPVAAIIMVSELTGNYNLLPALMFSATISYVITGEWSLYEKQVPSRVESPAHRKELTIDVLENAKVRDAMVQKLITVLPTSSIETVLNLVHKYGYIGYPVVVNGDLVGIITFEDAEKVPPKARKKVRVGEIMTKNLIVTYPEESLESALRKLVTYKIG
ncbi:MAG: chloride channel protein, partial [Methanosarcinales archaeon]